MGRDSRGDGKAERGALCHGCGEGRARVEALELAPRHTGIQERMLRRSPLLLSAVAQASPILPWRSTNLLNYIPEGIIILDKSKKIIFSNNSANNWFQIKLNENISGYLRNPDLLISIDKAFEGKKVTDFEIEIRNQAVFKAP